MAGMAGRTAAAPLRARLGGSAIWLGLRSSILGHPGAFGAAPLLGVALTAQ
jgi:hypothetical protein